MTPHTLTKTPKTAAKTAAISAADYFQAKLAYEMTAWRLKGLLDQKSTDYLVLDVRSPDEFAAGHLPGALNIPLAELTAKLATLPKNKTIVTYCGGITCQLAPKAALELAQKGFQVMELFGGIQDWKDKGFPIQK